MKNEHILRKFTHLTSLTNSTIIVEYGCVFLIKNICISQVSKCGFRSIWAYCENRHAISQYIEIYNSQYIKLLCIYSQNLNIRFFPLPAKGPLQILRARMAP